MIDLLATAPDNGNMGDFLLIFGVGFLGCVVLIAVGHLLRWWTFTLGRKG